jgi:hypothetical protein
LDARPYWLHATGAVLALLGAAILILAFVLSDADIVRWM